MCLFNLLVDEANVPVTLDPVDPGTYASFATTSGWTTADGKGTAVGMMDFITVLVERKKEKERSHSPLTTCDWGGSKGGQLARLMHGSHVDHVPKAPMDPKNADPHCCDSVARVVFLIMAT